MREFKFANTKLFNALLFTIMLTVVISQLGILTGMINSESVYTGAMGDAEEAGQLTLFLPGGLPEGEVAVLQNGEPVAVFVESSVNVTVRNNSVIEIDGSRTKQPFSVIITKKSDNIKNLNAEEIKVNSNITILGRIFIK